MKFYSKYDLSSSDLKFVSGGPLLISVNPMTARLRAGLLVINQLISDEIASYNNRRKRRPNRQYCICEGLFLIC